MIFVLFVSMFNFDESGLCMFKSNDLILLSIINPFSSNGIDIL